MNSVLPHIMELPQQIADKIAAGEVVERPLSIVKELVENSIDAGSTSIAVEIKNGGKTYIRVTDNGCGIAAGETELAFKRHATSKVKSLRDLDAIETLGFRGEALASIAAVSRTELITRTADSETGTHIVIEGGVTAEIKQTGCPVGTTIIVKDLFYNTPARLKFLKKDNTESTLIIDFISRVALAFPDIRVRLINNGANLFTTPGKGDRLQAIGTVFSPRLAQKLIRIDSEGTNGLVLEGYISSPEETNASRKNQIFFVNGRYIKSSLLEKCISDGYREKLFEGRHPAVFLFMKIDPAFVDVNIHPNKKEIRFDDDSVVSEFVTEAIKSGLRVKAAVPEIKLKASVRETPHKTKQIDIHELLKAKRVEENEAISYKPAARINASEGKAAEASGNTTEKPGAVAEKRTSKDASQEKTPATEAAKQKAPLFAPQADKALSRPFEVSAIRPIGAIFASYILGCDDDTFYMIDQHAAHERIFYEKLTRNFYGQPDASQILALPIKIDVTPAVKNAEEEWITFLRKTGFAVEEFGPRSYAVKEIPAYMSMSEAETFINDFFDGLDEPGAFRDKRRADKIIMRSCKSAVKANDRLDTLEIKALLDELAKADNPFSCPHGRPTIIRMKKSEIEALFKR